MLDTEKLRKDYEKDGFAILRKVIDPELIMEARAHVEWLAVRYPELRPEEYHHPLMRNDAFWVRMVADVRLTSIAEVFLGPDIACFTAHYICKPPGDGWPVLWHQDGSYWKLDPMEALTVWLAIDESTVANGCLRMAPGSHLIPLYQPVSRTDVPNMLFSACDPAVVREWSERADVVAVELEAGDVSIHHPHLLHYSEANKSPTRRCGLDIGYMPATTRISNEGLYLDPLLVRGEPTPGINIYRQYPAWTAGETIPFAGDTEWNDRAAQINMKHGFRHLDRAETPFEITRRMIARLKEGTVKQQPRREQDL